MATRSFMRLCDRALGGASSSLASQSVLSLAEPVVRRFALLPVALAPLVLWRYLFLCFF